MTFRILFVEDSATLQRTVGATLRHSGYQVDGAQDGEDGLWQARSTHYDVIILDVLLPRLDGLSILTKLRGEGVEAPVLMLTANTAIDDRVRGLELGADDYLCKPFSLDELVARVGALLRRKLGASTPLIERGDLRIDRMAKTVKLGDHALSLTAREFKLLDFLASRAGEVVSRAEIEQRIYDELVEPSSNVVDSAICLLRRKLSEAGARAVIRTKRGHGYVFDL